jgi:outer membrane protein assembly factor BamB
VIGLVAALAACRPAVSDRAAPDGAVRADAAGYPDAEADATPGRDATTVGTAPLDRYPARDALQRGAYLVLLEPDGKTMRAVDLRTNRTAWRQPLPGVQTQLELVHGFPEGEHHLALLSTDGLGVVEVATGRTLSTQTYPDLGPKGRLRLRTSRGACAIDRTGVCALQVIDCGTGRPLGRAWLGTKREGGAWCQESTVLRRTGRVLLLHHHDVGVLAVDAATGSERYRVRERALSWVRPDGVGASPDGRICWAADERHWVLGFDCATGQKRFAVERTLADGERSGQSIWSTGWVTEGGAGIIVQDRAGTWRLAPDTGRRVWFTPQPVDTLDLTDGLPVKGYPTVRALRLLSAKDGTVLSTLPVTPLERVDLGEGQLHLLRGGRVLDIRGRPVTRKARFWPTALPAWTPGGDVPETLVRNGEYGPVLATVKGFARLVGIQREGGEATLAILHHRAIAPPVQPAKTPQMSRPRHEATEVSLVRVEVPGDP